MVIVLKNKGFCLSTQTNLVSSMTFDFFYPSPKVSQLPSNLFISVVNNNEGNFFIYSLRVAQFLSNLTSVVNNDGF
jgi:hypothetical protein